jgi:hypothetical protein
MGVCEDVWTYVGDKAGEVDYASAPLGVAV